MSQKLSRRQVLKLLAIAAGGAVVAVSTKLNKIIAVLAETSGDTDIFLPFLVTEDSTPTDTATPQSSATSTATNTDTPTPVDTETPPPIDTDTPTPTDTNTPPPSPGIFVDGPGGNVDTGKDLLMSSYWPTRNGGQHASFQLEGLPGTIQHALLQFDLSSLPSNYTCTSAQLYLYHNYPPEHSGLNTGKVHRIAPANWPWIEGLGNIDPAEAGEPCWNARESDGNSGVQTPWAGSEGCSTPGVDYELTPMGEWSFDTGSPQGAEIVIDLDPAQVQGWFGSQNTNYGIILVTDDDVPPGHVGSAEEAIPGYRPKLVVHYE